MISIYCYWLNVWIEVNGNRLRGMHECRLNTGDYEGFSGVDGTYPVG